MDPMQIIRQTQANVDYLVKQNHISAEDGKALLDKLAACNESIREITTQAKASDYSQSSGSSRRSESTPPSDNQSERMPPSPPVPFLRVRAKWDWNHLNQNPNDLSFFKGDIFQLVEETSENWYTGKHFNSEKQGLFPANYVEKLPSEIDFREAQVSPEDIRSDLMYGQDPYAAKDRLAYMDTSTQFAVQYNQSRGDMYHSQHFQMQQADTFQAPIQRYHGSYPTFNANGEPAIR